VLSTKVWRQLVCVERSVIVERVDVDEDTDAVVVSVRPYRQRRWAVRALLGPLRPWGDAVADPQSGVDALLPRGASAPRVVCDIHGVVVAVPWARQGAGHTRALHDLYTFGDPVVGWG